MWKGRSYLIGKKRGRALLRSSPHISERRNSQDEKFCKVAVDMIRDARKIQYTLRGKRKGAHRAPEMGSTAQRDPNQQGVEDLFASSIAFEGG